MTNEMAVRSATLCSSLSCNADGDDLGGGFSVGKGAGGRSPAGRNGSIDWTMKDILLQYCKRPSSTGRARQCCLIMEAIQLTFIVPFYEINCLHISTTNTQVFEQFTFVRHICSIFMHGAHFWTASWSSAFGCLSKGLFFTT